ncbi:CPBP family intramembrane glutamic endopeptidase [Peptostreptococcus faecalis]|uniref:CPBP family intramembrane glutamic endopeptidase n=1 Tax=Peptostreptococcus faecalis TaxID=2045015 RepID=UPI000C7B8E32|nr:CPBP family intramembrane glutamic endopeptidase [Peptostreptococcus faecalis]
MSIFGFKNVEGGNFLKAPLVGSNTIIPIITSIIVILIFMCFSKKIKIQDFELKFINKKNIIYILVGFISMRIIAYAGTAILKIQGMENSMNDAMLTGLYKNTSWYLIIVTIVIFAPIVEEIIFRGYIIGRLFENKQILGIVVSSLIFGSIHTITNITSLIMYFLLGVVAGILYYKTKRLEVSIGAHLLNNLAAVIVMFFI